MKIIGLLSAKYEKNDIPNKYSRVIGGYSQIKYTFFAAYHSLLNIDLIVLTDIENVRKVCKKYNVRTEDINYQVDLSSYDIVIRFKPGSFGLSYKTFDEILDCAINNKIGLLKTTNEEIIIENRSGNGEYIYPIHNEDKFNINDYKNLFYCKDNNKKVGIYVNGSSERGLGHIYRALDIADDFNIGPDIYYDINQTNKEFFGETIHNLIGVNGIEELYIKCKENKYDIFINDILQTSSDYIEKLKECMPNCKIVNFEDDGEGSLKADVVINALYENSNKPNVYCGSKYYICDESFFSTGTININESVKNIFICFGGSDPSNYTEKLLKIVSNNKYNDYNFEFIVGPAKKNTEDLFKYNSYPNISVKQNVKYIFNHMKKADIAITSRGNVAYELAILGIPTISIAQNENEEKHNFACKENGFLYLGREPGKELVEKSLNEYLNMSKENRKKLQNILIELDLINNRKRILELIFE